MTLELARSEGEISEQAAEREAEGERERESHGAMCQAHTKREKQKKGTRPIRDATAKKKMKKRSRNQSIHSHLPNRLMVMASVHLLASSSSHRQHNQFGASNQ